MRNTGIRLYRLDTPGCPSRCVDSGRLVADVESAHGVGGPHARVFNTPTGQRLTVWWITDEGGRVTELFEDSRGLN